MDAMELRTRLARVFEHDDHPLAFEHADSAVSDGFAIEHLAFRAGNGLPVRGILTRPLDDVTQKPGILYIHAHGNRHAIGADELLEGRPALQGALGPVFARAGYVTLCIDLPCFGRRAGESESAAAKAAHWHGRALAGRMLGELASALTHLAGRADVDARRIGAFGISMGATLGYWLAAIDRRIACVAQLCCYADFAALIDTGAHDLHGPYLTVPGLLGIAGNGTIAGLVAPRPQLIAIGDRDPLTPPGAVDRALMQTRAAYAACPGHLAVHREPRAGHEETAAMRRAMLAFFARHLLQDAAAG